MLNQHKRIFLCKNQNILLLIKYFILLAIYTHIVIVIKFIYISNCFHSSYLFLDQYKRWLTFLSLGKFLRERRSYIYVFFFKFISHCNHIAKKKILFNFVGFFKDYQTCIQQNSDICYGTKSYLYIQDKFKKMFPLL